MGVASNMALMARHPGATMHHQDTWKGTFAFRHIDIGKQTMVLWLCIFNTAINDRISEGGPADTGYQRHHDPLNVTSCLRHFLPGAPVVQACSAIPQQAQFGSFVWDLFPAVAFLS